MGGTLGPLVQGTFISLRKRLQVSLVLATTFTLGTLGTFAIASLLNVGLVRRFVEMDWRLAGTAAGLVLLSALDLLAIRRNDYCPLTLRRQTPKALAARLGMVATVALWGIDLGVMVTTFRVASASWGVLMLVACGWLAPWSALFYAMGFMVPFLFLTWTGRLPRREPEHAAASLKAMLDLRRSAQWVSAGLLALGAILIAAGERG